MDDQFIRPQTNDQRRSTNYSADDMASPSSPDSYQPLPPRQEKRQGGKLKKFFKFLVILALLGAIGYGGYLYKQEVDRSKDLQAQVDNLKTQIAVNEQTPAQETAEPQQTVYKAEVGKFTLTLPSDLGVFVQHDGSGEGAPRTDIQVAKNNSPGVVKANDFINVKISAGGASSRGSFSEFKSNTISKDAQQKDNIKIDGITAEVYIDGGISPVKKVVFTNKNINYHFELLDDKENEALLKSIVNGFKFN